MAVQQLTIEWMGTKKYGKNHAKAGQAIAGVGKNGPWELWQIRMGKTYYDFFKAPWNDGWSLGDTINADVISKTSDSGYTNHELKEAKAMTHKELVQSVFPDATVASVSGDALGQEVATVSRKLDQVLATLAKMQFLLGEKPTQTQAAMVQPVAQAVMNQDADDIPFPEGEYA
jgi:hypothetical protein